MSEDVPQTLEEITAAIKDECAWHTGDALAELVSRMVVRWREAWLRDAEPRLRPVTEIPNAGDWIVTAHNTGSYRTRLSAWIWGPDCITSLSKYNDAGWYLIKRAAVPLTHEQALRLLISDIRSLGSPPEQLRVALAKAEEALGAKP